MIPCVVCGLWWGLSSGGASFAAFANTHASVTVKEQTEVIETVSAWATAASAAATLEMEYSVDLLVAPMGAGTVVEAGTTSTIATTYGARLEPPNDPPPLCR